MLFEHQALRNMLSSIVKRLLAHLVLPEYFELLPFHYEVISNNDARKEVLSVFEVFMITSQVNEFFFSPAIDVISKIWNSSTSIAQNISSQNSVLGRFKIFRRPKV